MTYPSEEEHYFRRRVDKPVESNENEVSVNRGTHSVSKTPCNGARSCAIEPTTSNVANISPM